MGKMAELCQLFFSLTVKLVPTLVRKWNKNEKLKMKQQKDMAVLNESVMLEDIEGWTVEINKVLDERVSDPKAMDHFMLAMKECQFFTKYKMPN